MKTCTGERYDGELLQLSTIRNWHGKFGHLNVGIMDHDDAITGYGKHDRTIAFHPQFDEIVGCVAVYCRVDHCWELGIPTEKQIQAVIRKDQDIRGRWNLIKTVNYDNGRSTDCYLTKQ